MNTTPMAGPIRARVSDPIHSQLAAIGLFSLLTFTSASVHAQSTNPIATQSYRYILLDKSGWIQNDYSNDNYVDLYTRFIVASDGLQGSQLPIYKGGGDQDCQLTSANQGSFACRYVRDYDRETRPWLVRLLADKTVGVVGSAKIDIRDPDISATIPLFSVSHTSTLKQGDNFATTFVSSDVTSPLFRIGANSTITIHMNEDAVEKNRSQAAALVLSAVTTAVRIASPSSSILTGQSKTDISNASTAIDAALSGLTSHEISEDISLGRLIDTYDPQSAIKVYGFVPAGLIKDTGAGVKGDDGQRLAQADKLVGSWRLSLECPRPSLFLPKTICDVDPIHPKIVAANVVAKNSPTSTREAPVEISDDDVSSAVTAIQKQTIQYIYDKPALILHSKLSQSVTIQDFIQKQSWFTSYIQKGQGTVGASGAPKSVPTAASTPPDATGAGAPPAAKPDNQPATQANNNPPAVTQGPTTPETLEMCSNLLGALYDQGLNQFDSGLVLYAIDQGLPGLNNRGIAKTCLQLVQGNAALNGLILDIDVKPPVKTSADTGGKSNRKPAQKKTK